MLIMQDLEERRYRILYNDDDKTMEVIGETSACEECTANNCLHINTRFKIVVSIKVSAIMEVWETSNPLWEPHNFAGETRIY